MKSGYQDAGSWTLLKSTPLKRQQAAWLYAQFVVSKTVSLKKTLVGLTPIRRSDIDSEVMTKQAPRLGGLVEFYRSRGRDIWTPTGNNVPDYPGLAGYWWQYISRIVEGRVSVAQGLQDFARVVDQHLLKLSKDKALRCRPELNPPREPGYWLSQPGSPKAKRDEKPPGKTLSYQEVIHAWQ
ncbi:hypothetical protein [Dongshaea marina]|uniref:hypothetical protein n=1 Tax=Dongshaea marina TaxID=2047966 RepID=UPI001900BCBD|nr:hypothetical protein [Dongshaea marina]